MSSDDAKRPADVSFSPRGPGLYQTFLCPLCAKFRGMQGRKLRRVSGLRQYCCAECAKERK